jgi:hypothetical protein
MGRKHAQRTPPTISGAAERTPQGSKESEIFGEAEQSAQGSKAFSSEQLKPATALRRILAKHLSRLPAFDILGLQRTIGNKAIQRILARRIPHSPLHGPTPHPGQASANEAGLQAQLQRQPLAVEDDLPLKPLAAPIPDSARALIGPQHGTSASTVRVMPRHVASAEQAQQPDGRAQPRAAGAQPQPVRVVPTTTRVNRAVIQRFNLAADNPYEPTTDLGHPALVNIGLAKIGPYKFYPMKGTFEYQPPDIAAVGVEQFLKLLVNHKVNKAWYGPELIAAVGGDYKWLSPAGSMFAGKTIKFHPGGIAQADPAARAAKAALLYATEKSGKYVPGKILDGLKSHNKGNTPRAFVNVAQEDAFGAAEKAHTASRHVLGGVDAPDADAVAARAAFGMLGGIVGGAVKGMYTPDASAFKTAGDANIDVGNAIAGELTKNWNKHRLDILTKGGVDLQVPRAGGQIVGYQSAKGAAWPIAERPTYLDPAAKGQKPLFYPDPRWDTWAAGPGGVRGAFAWAGAFVWGGPPFSAAMSAKLKATPLTKDTSAKLVNVHVRILASEDPNHQGWFIHSAYPIF